MSLLNLKSSFVSFIQEMSHTDTTLGTPDTYPNTSLIDVCEAAPNKGIFVLESGLALEISRSESFLHLQYQRRQKQPNLI